MNEVIYRTEVFSDGHRYVGLCPEFRISGTGDSKGKAIARLQKAVEAYLQECMDQGILNVVLEESGFEEVDDVWKLRERSSETQVAVIGSDQAKSMMSEVLKEGIAPGSSSL